MGGISDTFGGYITDLYNPVHKNHLGGISDTFGGYIRYLWGVYQIPLGGISDTKTPLEAAEMLEFFGPKLI